MKFQVLLQRKTNDPFFTKVELDRSFKRSGTTKASIANLLKRAVARKDVVRLRTGIYCLPSKYRSRLISPYEFLKKLDPFSYVTDLAALSYHELTPEAIGIITAFSEKLIQQQKPFNTEIGTFAFIKVPRRFLMFGVETVILQQSIEYRMATPLKAILDHSFITKKVWKNRTHVIHDLRLSEELMKIVNWKDLENYRQRYDHAFLNKVCENLND